MARKPKTTAPSNPVIPAETGVLLSTMLETSYKAEHPEEHAQVHRAGANLTYLSQILAHEHGRNVAGRLVYNLNFIAARLVRQALKHAIAEAKKTTDERIAESELNEFFGFTQGDDTAIPLETACHYQMVTWLYVMDIAHYSEADERGMKSKPFAWMADVVKTPVSMVYADARYGQHQQVAAQVANMAKLGMDEELMNAAQQLYDQETQAQAKIRIEEKVAVLKGYLRDPHAYKQLDTQSLHEAIEVMVSELGIDVPKLMAEIAGEYKLRAVVRAGEGKYLGDIDEQLLAFLPGHQLTRAESTEDRTAQAMAKYRARMGLGDGPADKLLAHQLQTGQVSEAEVTEAAQPAPARQMRRVKKAEAQAAAH